MEMMLQRRCSAQDHKGNPEVLNTTSHTEPQIMIVVDTADTVANANRRLNEIQKYSHSYFLSKSVISSMTEWVEAFNTSWTAMSAQYADGLPAQLFLSQLRFGYKWDEALIVQIQNMFERNEAAAAVNVSIDLSAIFDAR